MPGARRTQLTRRRLSALAAAALVPAVVSACASVIGVDNLTVGECRGGEPCELDEAGAVDGDTAQDGETEADAGDATLPGTPCPSEHGPAMLRVGAAGNSFCIDRTEVTVSDYDAFLKAKNGDTSGQPPECSWNVDYSTPLGGAAEIPVVGIDWCDARAYCAWAGKRLCGKVVAGKDPGEPLTYPERSDELVSQWYIACSAQGQLRFPYGSVFEPGRCNLGDTDAGSKAVAVEPKSACVGGYDGLYDMLGNVSEWIDLCQPFEEDAGVDVGDGGPQKHECMAKGGSWAVASQIEPKDFNCGTTIIGAMRDTRSDRVGIRCCSK